MDPQKGRKSSDKTQPSLVAQAFIKKFQALQKKWEAIAGKEGDSPEIRLVSPILFKKSLPIQRAIIADNLTYFKKHYQKSNLNLEQALGRACLYGSQAIGEFLMETLHVDFTNNKYDYLLGYVSASPNRDWTLKLAQAFKKAGKTIPSNVYSLCEDSELLDAVEAIVPTKPLF